MGLTKWLLTGLGFVVLSWAGAGPLGAILGYYIGSTIERNNQLGSSGDSFSGHRGPYRNTGSQDDINLALIVLIAAVIKADGSVKRSELDYVKRFLLKNYGEEKGKQYLAMLRDLVTPERVIDIAAICNQIKQNTDYTTRYHMTDFLFGLSVADNTYSQSENSVMREIANGLGINARDYIACMPATSVLGSRGAMAVTVEATDMRATATVAHPVHLLTPSLTKTLTRC